MENWKSQFEECVATLNLAGLGLNCLHMNKGGFIPKSAHIVICLQIFLICLLPLNIIYLWFYYDWSFKNVENYERSINMRVGEWQLLQS